MLQIINAKLENDFDNPLGLLSDCHRRIENFLQQIIRVCETALGGELSAEQREALAVALRYFRQAAPLHTADEETSLFPRLRERAQKGDARVQQALSVMERLEADHDTADVQHAVIDEIGTRWLKQNILHTDEVAQLEADARALHAFYAVHIELEDKKLFPLAGQVLAEDMIEMMGREMAARRGLDFDNRPVGSRCALRRAQRSAQ